ncbi:MAG: hypothetical protein Q7S02_04855 [bacterium]|nr:hypothetical protein [bacterium]
MSWDSFRTFAGTYLVPIGAVGVGIGLWMFLGWVFGSHAQRMRDAVHHGCTVAGDALGRAGDAVFGWARWCFGRIEQATDKFGDRIRQEPARDPDPPAVPAGDPSHALSSTIVFLGALVLIVFVCVNGYLLFEITPDLFSFSPDDVKSGSGKYIAWLVPIGILAGEVVGGLLVKSEQRRRAAGAAEASVKIAWMIFAFCYAVELAAGVRRAWAFLWVASPFADEATVITVDSAATAVLWLVLAGGIPWVIFALAAFVEPVITRSNAVGRVVTWFFSMFRTVGVGLLAFVAMLLALALFGGSGIVTGLVGVVLHALNWIVRYVVLAITVVLIVLCIQASWIVIQKIREWRGTNAATTAVLLVALSGMFAQTGCSGPANGTGASQPQRTYASVQASELHAAPSSESFSSIATVNLTRHIGENHKVVRVLDPKLHVCLADLSESIRSAGLRSAVLRKCAELVSDVTAEQGPETLGIVIPIVDAGLASETPEERFERADVPLRCATNPPLPQLPPRSTVADKQLQTIRAAYERAERECSEGVAREYGIARQARQGQTATFVARATSAFASQSYPRTDIFGTLALVHELVRTERARLGNEKIPIRVSIVSDLEDDANGCTVSRDAIRCPGDAAAKAKELCDDANARCTIYQVLQATPAARGRGFEAEKHARESRQQMWRELWTGLSDHISAFTFTAPATRHVPPPPAPRTSDEDDDGAHGGGAKQPATCSGADVLRTNRAVMANRTVNYAGWMAYGRALAACGPETKPWAAIGLPSKAKFFESVVLPFFNGDVVREGGFQKREPALHARITKAWGLE